MNTTRIPITIRFGYDPANEEKKYWLSFALGKEEMSLLFSYIKRKFPTEAHQVKMGKNQVLLTSDSIAMHMLLEDINKLTDKYDWMIARDFLDQAESFYGNDDSNKEALQEAIAFFKKAPTFFQRNEKTIIGFCLGVVGAIFYSPLIAVPLLCISRIIYNEWNQNQASVNVTEFADEPLFSSHRKRFNSSNTSAALPSLTISPYFSSESPALPIDMIKPFTISTGRTPPPSTLDTMGMFAGSLPGKSILLCSSGTKKNNPPSAKSLSPVTAIMRKSSRNIGK